MKMFSPQNRNFGLDIARCLAILLVLAAHSGIHFVFGINLGFLGVEIFFVLSGFLIGQIITREFKSEISLEKTGTFYINRWLRTFPLYYLVLLCKDLVVQGTFHPKHYFFIQQGSDLTFFPVSWSLAIEEWFYILIPLVFLVNIKLLKLPHLIFIGILMVLITFLRYIYIANSNPEFDLMVRKSIPLRFDALLTGVLFSIVKVNYSDLYKKISGIISLFLSISLFALGFIVYRKYVLLEASVAFGFQKNFFQAIIFIFFSFSFGFLIIWLESAGLNKLKKENLIVRIVTILSILTYAIYLIHYDIFKWMIHSQTFSSSWVKEISISLLVITGLTFLMHWLIEKPLMDYRKTLVKKLFSRNA